MLSIVAPGVLSNDTDVDSGALTAVVNGGPTHGALTLNVNGSFVYTPTANYNGSDSFTYRATDGTANSNIATVSLTVNAVNDAPVAVNDSYTATEDVVLSIVAPGVLGNDTDVEGNPLTAAVASQPTHGTLTFNVNGSFVYTPTANYNGSDSFTYRANDGIANSNVATVSITINHVNHAPVAVNDAYGTSEDAALMVSLPGVLGNDTDVDGNTLTAAVVSGVSHGALTLNVNGSFIYTPTANYNGSDSFTYRANDGTADSNVATVSLTINAVNDAPVAVNDAYSTNEDIAMSIATPGVLDNDTDVEGNPLTAALIGNVSHGTLALNADGSFVYTPTANYNGSDSFTYRANDGIADSNVATVNLTVNAVNDAPVAVNDAYTTNEDVAMTIVAPGVLGNDTDVDDNPLTAALVGDVMHGTLTLNADGSFVYTPAVNYNGSDSFTYRANDGTANSNITTVSLTINAVNDAPVAVNDAYSTNEDSVLTVAAPGVVGNDTDVEGNPLTAAVVSQPTHGTLTLNANGSFVYTPTVNYNGSDSYTYRVNDGTTNSNVATVAITIALYNPVPTITSLNPVTITAGSPPFLLTVTGAQFVNGSTIHWNGTALATTVMSSTQLQATIDTENILITGTVSVTVTNPAPGGGLSNVLTFFVEGPSPAPYDMFIYLPIIVRSNPASTTSNTEYLIRPS